MIKNELLMRNTHRLKVKREISDDDDEFLANLEQKNIITIDFDLNISQTLNQLLIEDKDVRFQSLLSLVKYSSLPLNFLECLTSEFFNILYDLLQNNEYMHLVLLIFTNLSYKENFKPPLCIFKIISRILQDDDTDDTGITNSLILSKNLIQWNVVYYTAALQSNILQIIINNATVTPQISKLKISALSSFLIYENHDTENYILNYIIRNEYIQSNKASIRREIINGLKNAMDWSEVAIQIINNSSIISISKDLLISEKAKNVNCSLSFLVKCVISVKIDDIQFVKSFLILMTKDEEDHIYEDIILSFICLITIRCNFRNFLFSSICEFGLNAILATKSYPIKKSFLSFLNESSKLCPKDVMIISPIDISLFLQEMIQTGDIDLQYFSLVIICTLISYGSDSSNNSHEWIKAFSNNLASLNILDEIYKSSFIEQDSNVTAVLDVVASLLAQYAPWHR